MAHLVGLLEQPLPDELMVMLMTFGNVESEEWSLHGVLLTRSSFDPDNGSDACEGHQHRTCEMERGGATCREGASLLSSATSSAEYVENVVSPPQKPVTTSKRHSGARTEYEPKNAIARPMT
jgi:hypothetical protein